MIKHDLKSMNGGMPISFGKWSPSKRDAVRSVESAGKREILQEELVHVEPGKMLEPLKP